MIGTKGVGYHQGQRSKAAHKGRTYDRSRPKGSKRKKPLAKGPSTYDVWGGLRRDQIDSRVVIPAKAGIQGDGARSTTFGSPLRSVRDDALAIFRIQNAV